MEPAQAVQSIEYMTKLSMDLDGYLVETQKLDKSSEESREKLLNYFKSNYIGDVELLARPGKSFLNQGGTDPLDIYIFKNKGDPSQGIPRHWHYIGLGLSDIHYHSKKCCIHDKIRDQDPFYERITQESVDPYPPEEEGMNGYGFELTFRLQCNSDQEWSGAPPGWPIQLMQNLAWYVFRSKNKLNRGEHVGWHSPLDGGNDVSTRIKHILITLDPQLEQFEDLELGMVEFLQIVGVSQDEFEGARLCSSKIILDMLKEQSDTGGTLLVTNMHRQKSIFELNPENSQKLAVKREKVGSNMLQLSNKLKVSRNIAPSWFIRAEEQQNKSSNLNENDDKTKPTLWDAKEPSDKKNHTLDNDDENDMIPDETVRSQSRFSSYAKGEGNNPEFFYSAYIKINRESARYLSIMLSDILVHKRAFSFASMYGDSAITFVPEDCKVPVNCFEVRSDKPFVRMAHWHQVYVYNELRDEMCKTIGKDFSFPDERLALPRSYSWPKFKLYITVDEEIE